jgi:hypothetical protein
MGYVAINFDTKRASGSGVEVNGTLAEASSLTNSKSKNPPKRK